MKKITFLILLTSLISISVKSQTFYVNKNLGWSDPKVYQLSPEPVINEYGVYSDSLSKVYDGKTFYEHDSIYYAIESWADYYYWFTQRYWYNFTDQVALYELYYYSKDDYHMIEFIANNYTGKYLPGIKDTKFFETKGLAANFNSEEFLKQNKVNKAEREKYIKDHNRIVNNKPKKQIARDNNKTPGTSSKSNLNKSQVEKINYRNELVKSGKIHPIDKSTKVTKKSISNTSKK